MVIDRRAYLSGMGAALGAGLLPDMAAAQTQSLPGLPSTMIWSVYDVGASGYVEASAIADALGKLYGTRVRLQPSGTSIGRIQPVKERRVTHGWLATEVFFAAEGLYEYAAPGWGPQDLRCLLGRVNSLSIVTTKTSGIKTLQDLKGKRYAIAKANTSVNAKVEPILDAAGISYSDMQIVEFPSYGASLKALVEGRADAAGAAPTTVSLRELEASSYGINWIELPASDKELWAKIQKAIPLAAPYNETLGAGITKENPKAVMGYRYPMITVYGDAKVDEVYAVTKAIVDAYDTYKAASPIMERWAVKNSGAYPMDAPFHDGAIKLLKEKNVWTPDHQKWQDGIVKRHKLLREAWAAMMKEPAAQGADAAKLLALWMPRRAEVLKSL
ncbi:MAG: TAXI family TRAP transporter solute-binding subunit [Hyphomicrobiaceae bacterium]